ncbi:MAG TPA: tripartite tricarboxylate transporter substrate binding protein [Ramlibacter sp.]|uniref:Bug family tripartite tricarboxylate transporter substrate binding protein n=1 Tax=Ramlibacter sp. TaxID=1917967 RepID=UPI002C545265|nr:tripartite tricarboxylate transporter substrate binding protein [Ramlibacter sp.]HVZ45775.1 tripartite tricarboxylate transporter substrate binding protein [Ramlibacter sp.]
MTIVRALLALLLASSLQAWAQTYPSRPITIVVPFAAGGLADASARQLALSLKEQLGQPVIVENRVGAGGTIGARAVQLAKPDGYTLLYGSVGPMVGSLYLVKDLPYHPLKDFVPVHGLTETPMVLVTQATKPYKTLAEFVAYAKANPGKATYGSVGVGSTLHLATVLLEQSAQIRLLHVPYKGSALALNDMLGGQIDILFDYLPTSWPHIESGKLRALAVSSSRRVPGRNIPTAAEQGLPEVVLSPWYGIFAPAGTPADVVQKLSQAFGTALKKQSVVDYNYGAGAVALDLGPRDFATFIEREIVKWKDLVEKSGATASN